jgi:hypothetical protein
MNTLASNSQQTIELRLKQLRILWLGGFGSLAGFYVLTLFTDRPEAAEPNNTLFLVFVVIALAATLVSFVVKNRLFNRAVDQQNVELVQQGFIMAAMVNEVGALLGLFDYFTTGDRYYYILILIAVCGLLLHFPRREPLVNATFAETSELK